MLAIFEASTDDWIALHFMVALATRRAAHVFAFSHFVWIHLVWAA